MSFQTLIFEGNLGRDPEMRFTTSGKPVTSFSVAVSNKYTTSSGEKVNETTWFKVTVWDKMAENCNQYLKKGSKVLVEGKLKPDEKTGAPKIWQRQDGTSGTSFDVNASSVVFLSASATNSETHASAEEPGGGDGGNDIPF